MGELSVSQQEILNRVYKGPNKTGDNIDGLVLLPYDWNGSSWIRRSASGTKPTAYDTKSFTYSTSSDAIAYTLSGTTIATKTINYSDSTKGTITSVVWS